MISTRLKRMVVCAISVLAMADVAQAQMAVIDYTAAAQLVQQVQATQQVLTNARNQLNQAQVALQTMTGGRGMQLLLNSITRNYLPRDWQLLGGTLQGLGTGYPALASSVGSLVTSNAVLSSTALSSMSIADQQRISAARYLVALNQAVTRNALSNASERFADLQSLIGTIGSASDQKAILDLHARIGAEQGMLLNEQTKLQSLYQAMQAQDAAAREQMLEQVVASHGQFSSRFQPSP